MIIKYDFMFILLILSSLLVLAVSIYVMKLKKKKQIHYFFFTDMILLSIWSFARVIQIFFQSNEELVIFMEIIVYVGCIFIPISLLYTGIVFAKTKIEFSKIHLLLLIVPTISFIMILTNKYHNLFIIKYSLISSEVVYGKYYFIHEIFSYTCILIGLYYLMSFSIKNSGFFSKQSFLIFLGLLFPLLVVILTTQKVISVPLYIENISFSILIICIMLAIFKFQFLNVVPIALQRIVDIISDGYIVIDENYDIIDYNKTCIEMLEFLNIKRKNNLLTILDSTQFFNSNEFINNNEIAIRENKTIVFEKQIFYNDNNKYFSIEVTPIFTKFDYIGTIYLMKNITEHVYNIQTIKRNQEILMEQERLASLGQLISGIAHNLKTPIMSISGAVEALKELIEEYDYSIEDKEVTTEDHHEIAEEMNSWIEKIKPHCSYMSDIISAVKGQAVKFHSSIDVGFVLDELIKRIQILMKHELLKANCILNIQSHIDLNSYFKGDINSLVQVFDNIIVNAIHAYEGQSGTIDFIIDKDKNNYLFIVTDYAKGIPLNIQDKLLKEMITTKGTKGTGLGLYMSYSTIKGHFSGNMWFHSEVGIGTSFCISIPCYENKEGNN